MMGVLLTMLRVLLCLPLAVVWMLMVAIIMLGWGPTSVDNFIKAWNSFIDEDVMRFEGGQP